ncbi:MAG: PEP-CTERM sorting domain-containing protein [Burkholderiales bacterium]
MTNGVNHGYLATQVPEPDTATLLAIGILGLLIGRLSTRVSW